MHRAKCEEQRSVVEAALAKVAGAPVALELLDGDGDGVSGGDGGARGDARNDGGAVLDGGSSGAASPSSAPTASVSEPPAGDAVAEEDGPVVSSSPRERGLAAAAALGQAASDVDEQPVSDVELPHDDDVDLDGLVDAPPKSVKSPIDRLAEAFPGSELIEEAG